MNERNFDVIMIVSILTACLWIALFYGRHSNKFLFIGAIFIAVIIFIFQKKKAIQSIDVLVQQSDLLTWNTELKFFTSIFLLFFCVIANSLLVSLIIIIMISMITIRSAHLHISQYMKLLIIPTTFLVISGLVLLINIHQMPSGIINIPVFDYYLVITETTQEKTAHLLLKAIGALCCLYALSLSTPVYELTAFFDRIHVPAIMIELAILMYRYIFILEHSLQQMKIAAQSRLGYRNYRNSWRSFCGIASNLLVRSFIKANHNFDAMIARGYHEKIQFMVEKKPVQLYQICLSSMIMLIPIITLLLERQY